MNRTTLHSAVLWVAIAAWPGAVRADPLGGDVVVLTGILADSLKQSATLAQQLQALNAQVEASMRTLQTLDPAVFGEVVQHLHESQANLKSLSGDLGGIGYSLGSLDARFGQLFRRDLEGMRFSDFDALYGSWQEEITSAAQVAMRAQSNLHRMESSSDAARQILARSATAGGEVRQLQSVLQMLAVMQQQLTGIAQSLDTANRVTSTMAASSAGEKQLARERRRRRIEGYTKRGKPAQVLRQLPTLR